MLNFNNVQDIPEMMDYHRTRDMINLLTFFPDISPVRNLCIIKSIEDYLENYEYCKKLSCERNDTLRKKPSMKSVETDGMHNNIEELFKKIKKLDKDGVILLFDLCHEPSERYKRYAGISVGVSLGNGVFIDAVGKGFDGREVSKGICSHERYYIPWFEMRHCNIENFRQYRTFLISNKEYQQSREARIQFLSSFGISKEELQKYIPTDYTEIPNFIWLDVLKNIIKKLEKMEEELISAGLREFAISGHTEGKQFMPWQIFDKSRYTGKKF